jgi:4-amino-4-deoxy-L-arabinose transferase-like glycosyltransferase
MRTRSRAAWTAAFVLLGAAVVARNVIALSTVPPGLYVDEASIGYNAWALAHHGVDEHGYSWPLYFEAFGEYKNPVYVYALVPFARLMPLTATTERLPAALFGLVTVLFVTLMAWRVTRSRWAAVFACVIAAVTPWLVQESRVGFEVISMVATLSICLWLLSDEQRLDHRRFALAGLFLALSIFAYSTGRLLVVLFSAAFAVAYARRRFRGWWVAPTVVVAAYAGLGVWAVLHQGALTAEFNARSIAHDGAPLATLAGRFVSNYISYFSVDFLFLHGDANLRHNTGYAGMLLAVTLPLLLLGLAGCWRRRREALPKFLILCLVVGPVAAALVDNGGAPHALRSAAMLPFWLLLMVFGLDTARAFVRRHSARAALAALLAAGIALQTVPYLLDMYTAYPVRAASWFDTGLPSAIAAGWYAAHGREVFISDTFEAGAAYIDADFALLPAPPATPHPTAGAPQMQALRISVTDPRTIALTARPGDVAVLAPADPVPGGAVLLHTEYAPGDPLQPQARPQAQVVVYRVPPSA